MENHQNLESSLIFTQKPSEPPVSTCFNWADDADLSPAPTTIVAALETCSAQAGFMKKHQKVEKWPVFTRHSPETPSTTPMKYPRDFSGLRSSSPNPFSSLRRRRRNYKNPRHFFNSRSQSCCQHTFQNSHYHLSTPHIPYNISQPPSSASLNWDQDPRLVNLSNALKALGWTRL
jgi:hypothetical protein